jgi:uncharacterized protein (TIGR04255 family)
MAQTVTLKNSPLIELVCGIQYDISTYDFTVENAFYSKVKNSFPEITRNIPLALAFDKSSGVVAPKPSPAFQTTRYFFINKNNNKLIQLQEGRYLFNWRKQESNQTDYPRFKNVYGEFKSNWETLSSTLKEAGSDATINQLELTYIDHIYLSEMGVGENGIARFLKIVNQSILIDQQDALNLKITIPSKAIKGHIIVTLNTASRISDKKSLYVLDITARGMLGDVHAHIDSWFTEAHDLIIKYFLDLLTDEAKEKWVLAYE